MNDNEKKKIYDEVVAQLKSAKGDNYDADKDNVGGGGGVPVGTNVTLTGKVLWNENKETPAFSYHYLETKEGVKVSVTSFMGIASFSGCIFCDEKDIASGTPVEDAHSTVYATMPASRKDEVMFIGERNRAKAITHLISNEEKLKDREIEFLGSVVKLVTLREGKTLNGKKYAKGAQLAIANKFWSKIEL